MRVKFLEEKLVNNETSATGGHLLHTVPVVAVSDVVFSFVCSQQTVPLAHWSARVPVFVW